MLVSNNTADAPTDPTDNTATSTDDGTDTSSSTDDGSDNATSTDPSNEDEDVAYCTQLKSNIAGSADWNIIASIVDGATISGGDELSGCVYSVNESYGGWAPFEGQIGSYEVVASDGTSLGLGPIPTVDNWMELGLDNEPIRYMGTLDFDASGYSEGTLILRNENASGMPEMDESIEIDVVFE